MIANGDMTDRSLGYRYGTRTEGSPSSPSRNQLQFEGGEVTDQASDNDILEGDPLSENANTVYFKFR